MTRRHGDTGTRRRGFTALLLLFFLLLFNHQSPIINHQSTVAEATVTTTSNRMDQVATAGQVIFPYTFKIFAGTDLKVYVNGVLKTLTTHYSVSGVLSATGGNVTFVSGLTAGDTVAIIREVPYTQTTHYVPNSPFPAASHENALDRQVMLSQQLYELIGRAPKLGAGSALSPTLANPVAGEYLRWNLAGLGIESTAQISTLGQFTASGAGAVARTVDSKLGDVVSVKDFGAKGDGVSDDTSAIQTAIDSLLVVGGTVFLPAGIYKITSEIVISGSMVHVLGEGKFTTSILLGNDTQDGIRITAQQHNSVRKLGFYPSGTRTDGWAIRVDGPVGGSNIHSKFEDLIFYDTYGGIIFEHSAYFLVRDSTFAVVENFGILIRNDSDPDYGDSAVVSCDFEDNVYRTGVAVFQQSSGGLRLIGNKFNGYDTAYYLNPTGASSITIINGNSIENQASYGIAMERSTGTAIWEHVIISGNQFAHHPQAAIAQDDPSWLTNLSITGNTFLLYPGDGPAVKLSGVTAGIVSGNTIRGVSGTLTGIQIESDSTNVIVGANAFHNLTTDVSNASTTSREALKVFVERGDPSAVDYTLANFTTDAGWHDLDLSALVPAGARFIKVKYCVAGNTAGNGFYLRKNGNSNTIDTEQVMLQVAGVGVCGSFYVACDSGRVVEYMAANITWTLMNATVVGWEF